MTAKSHVLFLAPAVGKKPLIVLRSLISSHSFMQNYEFRCIVDEARGPVVDFLTRKGIRHEVAKVPDEIVRAAHALADDGDRFSYLVSCGWSKKLPAQVLALPSVAAVNCHSSYLPDYKGASVYIHQWANAEKWGGATIHLMNEQFDSGNIICKERFAIRPGDSPGEILNRASELSAVLLREAFILLDRGYEGVENRGGRYFLRTTRWSLILHRAVNLFLRLAGSEKRWLTKCKPTSTPQSSWTPATTR